MPVRVGAQLQYLPSVHPGGGRVQRREIVEGWMTRKEESLLTGSGPEAGDPEGSRDGLAGEQVE